MKVYMICESQFKNWSLRWAPKKNVIDSLKPWIINSKLIKNETGLYLMGERINDTIMPQFICECQNINGCLDSLFD